MTGVNAWKLKGQRSRSPSLSAKNLGTKLTVTNEVYCVICVYTMCPFIVFYGCYHTSQ